MGGGGFGDRDPRPSRPQAGVKLGRGQPFPVSAPSPASPPSAERRGVSSRKNVEGARELRRQQAGWWTPPPPPVPNRHCCFWLLYKDSRAEPLEWRRREQGPPPAPRDLVSLCRRECRVHHTLWSSAHFLPQVASGPHPPCPGSPSAAHPCLWGTPAPTTDGPLRLPPEAGLGAGPHMHQAAEPSETGGLPSAGLTPAPSEPICVFGKQSRRPATCWLGAFPLRPKAFVLPTPSCFRTGPLPQLRPASGSSDRTLLLHPQAPGCGSVCIGARTGWGDDKPGDPG